VGTIFGSVGRQGHRVLSNVNTHRPENGRTGFWTVVQGSLPFRTNMTPTHSDGSPGVMLRNTPSSCA
jgi:hypothetical protein